MSYTSYKRNNVLSVWIESKILCLISTSQAAYSPEKSFKNRKQKKRNDWKRQKDSKNNFLDNKKKGWVKNSKSVFTAERSCYLTKQPSMWNNADKKLWKLWFSIRKQEWLHSKFKLWDTWPKSLKNNIMESKKLCKIE